MLLSKLQSFLFNPPNRDVLKHLSAHRDHVDFCKDELAMKSVHPSDKFDFSIIPIHVLIQDWHLLVRTSKILEILVLKKSKDFCT